MQHEQGIFCRRQGASRGATYPIFCIKIWLTKRLSGVAITSHYSIVLHLQPAALSQMFSRL